MDKVQNGKEPTDWKPMPSIGEGVKELRVQDETGAFRVIYLAKLANSVYVLHCFQKKTQQTSEKDIKLARKRFKDLIKEQP
jgi:phage-related protein